MSGRSGCGAALRRYATLAEVLWNESYHGMGWVEALETPTLTALTEVYLLRAEAFLTGGALPFRWRWCPECNGECRVSGSQEAQA